MPGAFHGINLASSALRAFQRAMETSGNNLANVNTRGYSRQRTELSPMESTVFWNGTQHSLGSGVRIENITRAREMFLEARHQGATSDFHRFSTYTQGLQEIESLFREPGETGIGHALDRMFDSFSALSSNPSDSGARIRVRDAASLLATRIRTTHSELATLRTNTEESMTAMRQQIDSLTGQVATLNQAIRNAQSQGGVPNDLLDQRDLVLRDLSQLVNVTVAPQSDGTVNLYMTNLPLVLGHDARPFPTGFDAATQTVTNGTDSWSVRGGQFLGLMNTINRIDAARTELDTFANQLRTQFNLLHQTGINLQGQPGGNFFNDVPLGDPQTGAADFNLDPAILASTGAIAAGTTNAPGDGGLALAMSQLRNQQFTGLGNRTFQQFYRDTVGGVATDIGFNAAQSETFESVLVQIDAQVESISGVNVDEEMTDLMRFQRSYQAAARVLTIMDQTTEDLINMVRR